jgi:hypothetical protein
MLCLNGLGLASGNTLVGVASTLITCAAYGYRIHVEDAMLIRNILAFHVQVMRRGNDLIYLMMRCRCRT